MKVSAAKPAMIRFIVCDYTKLNLTRQTEGYGITQKDRAGFALGKRSQRGVIAAKYSSAQPIFVAALRETLRATSDLHTMLYRYLRS